MSVSIPRLQAAFKQFPSSRRAYSALGYVPHQATQEIDPITPRAKPPAFFYTGKPNLYSTINKLETELYEIRTRLRQARVFPFQKGMPEQPKNSWKWKDREELIALMSITVLKKSEHERLVRILERLTRARHVANCASDPKSVARITELITPYVKVKTTGVLSSSTDATASNETAKRIPSTQHSELDEHGRSHTTGSRKTAKAQVWMIPSKSFAEQFNSIAEKKRQEEWLVKLEEQDQASAATEEKAVAFGAKNLAPVWERRDELEELAWEKEKARLLELGLPVPSRSVVKGFVFTKKSEAESKEVDLKPYERVLDEVSRLRSAKHLKKVAEREARESSTTEEVSPGSSSPSSTTFDAPAPSNASSSPPTPSPSAAASPSSPTSSPTPPPLATASNNPDSTVTTRDGTISVTNPSRPPLSLNSDPELGAILINNLPLHRYFSSPKDREAILRPFKLARLIGAFNVFALVHQGGSTGQAEAVALAIARGLAVHQPMVKTVLQQSGSLSVDHRQVERKKTGRPKARKANQWVKR